MVKFSQIDDKLSVYHNNKVVIYGAGDDGKKVKHELDRLGIDSFCFCDNDPDINDKVVLGLKVINHNQLVELERESIIVQVATRKYENEVIGILKESNIPYISYAEYEARITGLLMYRGLTDGMIGEDFFKSIVDGRVFKSSISGYLVFSEYLSPNDATFVCMPPKTGNYSMYKTLDNVKYHYFDIHHTFEELNEILKRIRYTKRIKIIISVREPVGQNISLLFQHTNNFWNSEQYWKCGGDVERFFPSFMYYQIKDKNVWKDIFPNDDRVRIPIYDHFHKICRIAIQDWFECQFRNDFGIDVYGHEFDRDAGYQIINVKNFSVLIFQHERINDIVPILNDFLDTDISEIAKENVGSQKWYSDYYKKAVKNMRLSKQYIEWSYSGKMASHFYNKKDIEKFRSKWTNLY